MYARGRLVETMLINTAVGSAWWWNYWQPIVQSRVWHEARTMEGSSCVDGRSVFLVVWRLRHCIAVVRLRDASQPAFVGVASTTRGWKRLAAPGLWEGPSHFQRTLRSFYQRSKIAKPVLVRFGRETKSHSHKISLFTVSTMFWFHMSIIYDQSINQRHFSVVNPVIMYVTRHAAMISNGVLLNQNKLIMSTESWSSFHSRYQSSEYAQTAGGAQQASNSGRRGSFGGVFKCISCLIGSPSSLRRDERFKSPPRMYRYHYDDSMHDVHRYSPS